MRGKILSLFIPLVVLLSFTVKEGKGQGSVPNPPDCVIVVNNLTAAGSTAAFPNYFTACQSWTFQYTSVGFSGLTVTVQSAPAATPTTPGAWVTYAGTLVLGSNPNTSTTGAVSTFKNGIVDIPFIRVNLSGLTGTGTVYGVLYGYKTGYTGGTGTPGNCPQGAAGDVQYYVSAVACGGDAGLAYNSGTQALTVGGALSAAVYLTATNCADSAGAAACGSAPAGAFVVDATTSSTVVSTTAVTANSEILVTFDAGLGTRLGITCNAAVPPSYFVSARTAGASFTLTSSSPVTNPACFNYAVLN